MNHIPPEVLHEIFTRLCSKDRLECMFVCRAWYDALDRRSLLYSLDITLGQCDKINDMLESFPHRRPQVEYLTLYASLMHEFDKRLFFNVFPNLRQFDQIHRIPLDSEIPHVNEIPLKNCFERPFHFNNATSKLNKLSDFGACQLTHQLAMSNSLGGLNSLKMDFHNLPLNNMLYHLRNMPVLQHLGLTRISLSLLDLELLHRNSPSIVSLSLNGLTLDADAIPQGVVPASALTKIDLTLDAISDFGMHIQFYNYLESKYPSVENPVYADEALKQYCEEDIHEIYNRGVFLLYQKIGSQVDYFKISDYFDSMGFIFRRFDEFGIQLRELHVDKMPESPEEEFYLLGGLSQSQQPKYLQSLILMNIIPADIGRILNMDVLETLVIDCEINYEDARRIHFSALVSSCPATLTTLYVSSVYLIYDPLISFHTTSIKHLTLKKVRLAYALSGYIEACFPNLLTLNLRVFLPHDVTLSLQNHQLDKLTVTIVSEKYDERNFCLYKTMYDGDIHSLTPPDRTGLELYSRVLQLIYPSVKKIISSY